MIHVSGKSWIQCPPYIRACKYASFGALNVVIALLKNATISVVPLDK